MNPEEYILNVMREEGIEYVTTLPCEKIKNLLNLLSSHFNEIKLTREECGLGICSGIYLAGGRGAMVIQSTGIGNSMNAITSLCKTYGIAIPILASWRGVYEESIPAQVPLGRALPKILDATEIPYETIEEKKEIKKIKNVIEGAYKENTPYLALISPKIWEGSELKTEIKYPARKIEISLKYERSFKDPEMTRYEAISYISEYLDGKPVISNIGVPSKELYAIKDQPTNFYMLGSLGLASSIGLGVSTHLAREVIVLDGDGSMLMNPNVLIDIVNYPSNLTIFLLDNGAHGSTGGQMTSSYDKIDLELIARAFGIKDTWKVSKREEMDEVLKVLSEIEGKRCPKLVHVILKPGNRNVLNVPMKPLEIKERFMKAMKN